MPDGLGRGVGVMHATRWPEGHECAESGERSRWYALRVDHRHGLMERHVAAGLGFPIEEILRRHGIEPFVPVETKFIRRTRTSRLAKKKVKRAILIGYVLVRLAPPVNWLAVLSIPLVTGVVGFGGRPVPIGDAAVERLAARAGGMRARDYHRPMPTNRWFDPGDRVEVLDGPLRERVFTVVGIEGEMARVFQEFFGVEHQVEIATSCLARVAS
ncbi:MAG TPA: transcription termination/antitermination NusG family protein [Amaricoccus sp.]|uniref:transcription termination/antitermination protein NusG n=1 Tax=Amaricoccus sp. TaxID=1872485 RepID=UPI002BD717CE|nr:transcription termination/antitermination NusG family protein [Amaricoccus sp.]HMR51208.1 transcription termination/antitermination NusG family protein [Amaricoccus sp.]HMT98043.1 transcription termination/antitermination NusG family protein [Amaricoccus sp.]